MFQFLTRTFERGLRAEPDDRRRESAKPDDRERTAHRPAAGRTRMQLEALEERANPGGGYWLG